MEERDVRPGTLADAVTKGIDRGLRDMGADLSGCTPSMLSGWVIRELKDGSFHPAQAAAQAMEAAAYVIPMHLRYPSEMSAWLQGRATAIRNAISDDEAARIRREAGLSDE